MASKSPEFTIYSNAGQSDPFVKIIHKNFRQMGYDVSRKPSNWAQWKKARAAKTACLFVNKPAPHADAFCAFPVLKTDRWFIEKSVSLGQGTMAEHEFESSAVDGRLDAFLADLKSINSEPVDHVFAMQDFVLVLVDDGLRNIPTRDVTAIRMIKDVQKFAPNHEIVVHLDLDMIGEKSAEKLRKLDRDGRMHFSSASLDRLLPACAFVVSQDGQENLRAALHQRPSLVFCDSYFHHLSRGPKKDGRLRKSFNRMERDRLNYAAYLKWVIGHSIDMTANDATEKTLARLQELEAS